ncbi:leupeptin-inactivating enzyme 1 precursor [Pyrenophora tritici-repentis]|nr:leupeptin-inactivating enzyme 1 precursor [Pyrenophora tritici-repentis]KAI1527714.1 leupeptin-inactivating enzyme 1 precursor [Pyrenophora tritici-repentis]KAI1565621.1 leupeptin-inactivating enzyme 1 precursor [Pyrenophora tritici-repentis]KAI1601255.1 leupeptin-inactivating enzyme 1 precursor [Pyrenophora tritici-repentis]
MAGFKSKSIAALAACVAAVDAAALQPRQYKTLVNSQSLRDALHIDNLFAKAEILQEIAYSTPGKNRVIGSQGHEDTVEYIKGQLEAFPDYYNVYTQDVPLNIGTNATLMANNKTIEAFAVTLAPGGNVTGPLVAIPNLGCEEADFPESLAGCVALIKRGTCSYGEKVEIAAAKGAVGVVAWNNAEGTLEGYSLQVLFPKGEVVPTAGITMGQGEALLAQIQAGVNITVDMMTDAKIYNTRNVIAETKAGDHDNVIHVSGHSDSVTAGPGINDNGSGSMSILEIAIQLTNFTVNNAVRFSWWTAEEAGLLGSEYYVHELPQDERDKIRLMLDYDMMASPNFAIQIYDGDGSAFNLTGPSGSAEAEHEVAAYFDSIGLNHTEIEFDGRSDYGPFLEAGIAAGGIAGGAEGIKTEEEAEMFGGGAGVPYDVNYHEDGDTVNNLNLDAWIEFTRAIAHMTATYAVSWDGIPPRNATAARKRSEMYGRYKKEFRKTERWQRWV